MGIFDKTTEKSDYDKLGIQVVRPYMKKGRWVFDRDGTTYDMAPAGATAASLSPVIVGADRIIEAGCREKGIDPAAGFDLLFSESYFPNADVIFKWAEGKFDGWIYNVEGLNMKITKDQQVWVCPYLSFFYKKPPKALYIKIEVSANEICN